MIVRSRPLSPPVSADKAKHVVVCLHNTDGREDIVNNEQH